MVSIRTYEQAGRKYYTLVHTVRDGRRTIRREKHLGREIPENLDEIIENFRHELYVNDYEDQLTAFQRKSQQSLRNMPISAKKKHYEDFAVRFTYDSNRIEGSTLTYRETARLLLENQAPARPLEDIQEAKTHYTLFETMMQHASTSDDLHHDLVLEWHYLLFKDSKPDIAGKIRTEQVRITGSEFIPPSPVEIYPLLDDFFQWYNEEKKSLHPVELAALVHYKFVCIHPFWDGNGRMSRMLMNFVLYKNNYPMYNFLNKERRKYLNSLNRSDKNKDSYIFIRFFTRRYVKQS